MKIKIVSDLSVWPHSSFTNSIRLIHQFKVDYVSLANYTEEDIVLKCFGTSELVVMFWSFTQMDVLLMDYYFPLLLKSQTQKRKAIEIRITKWITGSKENILQGLRTKPLFCVSDVFLLKLLGNLLLLVCFI